MDQLLNFIGWDPLLQTKNRFTYIINSFSIGLVLLFFIFYITVIRKPVIILFTLLCLAVLFCVFIFLKKRHFAAAKIIMIFGFMFQEFSLVFLWFPKEANFNYFYFIVAPITFFIYEFDILNERAALIITNIIAVGLIIMSETITIMEPLVSLTQDQAKLITVMSLTSTICSITVVFYFYAHNLSTTNKELKLLANTDVLTKISNRRTLIREGESLFDFSVKYKKKFGLIIFDIDYFKRVNDQYGHPSGDSVLVQMTELVSSNIREQDILARYGGEEFALLLKDSSLQGNLKAAEHLRETVELNIFRISDDISIDLTISLGVTVFSASLKNFDEMISKADKALYNAKTNGRNRVETL